MATMAMGCAAVGLAMACVGAMRRRRADRERLERRLGSLRGGL